MDLKIRLTKIKAIFLDVDGVLTDGRIIYDDRGRESKNFNVQDGFGLVMAQKLDFITAIISARHSKVVQHRAKDLRITDVFVGAHPKLDVYEQLLAKYSLADQQVCFVGDDLPDYEIMQRAGVAVAVNNAVDDIKAIAHYITKHNGGQGAVREVIDLILKSQGLYEQCLISR